MLEIGSLVDGKYKILNKVGQGGMSVVYLAMNEKANKQWAVKEVRKDGIKDFEVVKQGLVAETDILKKLNHPVIKYLRDDFKDFDPKQPDDWKTFKWAPSMNADMVKPDGN